MKYLITILLLTGCNDGYVDNIHKRYKEVSQTTCELGAIQVLHRLITEGKITMEEYLRTYKPAAIYECDKVIEKVYGK